MSTESAPIDPYEAVLADLRAKRAQIDSAITAIEALRSGSPVAGAGAAVPTDAATAMEGPGAFLGMTIPEAAKKLLASRRQPMRNPDIAAAFKAGGLHMNSVEPANTIGSVLMRRATEVGDIVKIGRGTWGLKEWYPNRSFKKEKAANDETKAGSETEKPEPTKAGAPVPPEKRGG